MVLLSDEYDFREGLSVLFLVALEVGDSLSQLGSSGEEEVVEQVFSPIDIDGGVLDVLLQLDHHGIVLVGPHVEVELQLLQSVVQVRQLNTNIRLSSPIRTNSSMASSNSCTGP